MVEVHTTIYGRKENYKHPYLTVHDTADQEDEVIVQRKILLVKRAEVGRAAAVL